MLQYNFTKVFASRGIDNPYRFLKKEGFTHSLAHRIARNKTDKLFLEHLEKLCMLLYCTPNDLMDWYPKMDSVTARKHPLSALKKELRTMDVTTLLRETPLDKLDELQSMIEKLK